MAGAQFSVIIATGLVRRCSHLEGYETSECRKKWTVQISLDFETQGVNKEDKVG